MKVKINKIQYAILRISNSRCWRKIIVSANKIQALIFGQKLLELSIVQAQVSLKKLEKGIAYILGLQS